MGREDGGRGEEITKTTAGGEVDLYASKFNFDRAGSHPIGARPDRRQPPSPQ